MHLYVWSKRQWLRLSLLQWLELEWVDLNSPRLNLMKLDYCHSRGWRDCSRKMGIDEDLKKRRKRKVEKSRNVVEEVVGLVVVDEVEVGIDSDGSLEQKKG